MQITYQKKDGSIIKRLRSTELLYKIGQETSMGWKVLNIEYEYKNKFYSEYGRFKEIQKDKKKEMKKQEIKKFCKNQAKTLANYFVVILIVNFFKMI